MMRRRRGAARSDGPEETWLVLVIGAVLLGLLVLNLYLAAAPLPSSMHPPVSIEQEPKPMPEPPQGGDAVP